MIFGLIPTEKQLPLIKKYCFDKCGEILIGGLTDDIVGAVFPCNKKVCPYEEKKLKYGKVKNEVFYLRKLKEAK